MKIAFFQAVMLAGAAQAAQSQRFDEGVNSLAETDYDVDPALYLAEAEQGWDGQALNEARDHFFAEVQAAGPKKAE